MKGHAKIELTDHATGRKVVHEDDNLVTSALQMFMQKPGCACYPISYATGAGSGSEEAWKTLLGGIFLFDSVLEENVNNFHVPGGVKMIGNGSDISNSSAVTEMGSFSEPDSGIQEDGSLKLVWDYTASQANGTIRSVCLTSKAGGFNGLGNVTSGEVLSGGYSIFSPYPVPSSTSDVTWGMSVPSAYGGTNNYISLLALYADYLNNCIYFVRPATIWYNSSYATEHVSATGKITIDKFRMPLSKYDVRTKPNALNDLIESIDVVLPAEVIAGIGTSVYFEIAVCDSNIYLLCPRTQSTTIANGATFYILKIDAEFKTTLYTLVNNFGGKTITSMSGYNLYNNFFVDREEYVYFPVGANLYRFKLSNQTEASEVGYGGTYAPQIQLGGRLLAYSPSHMWDASSGEYMRTSAVTGQTSAIRLRPMINCNDAYYIKCVFTRTQSGQTVTHYLGIQLGQYNAYLATINNLETPVTKTASQSMRITYTLQFT